METYKYVPVIKDQAKLKQRFILKVEKTTACWLWKGQILPNGYGRVSIAGHPFLAHRISYILFKGSITDDRCLDHLCRVHSCVNPDHLEVVTNKTNILRGVGPTSVNATKTTCGKGHPLSGSNLYIFPSTGGRTCKKCKRANLRRWRAANGR